MREVACCFCGRNEQLNFLLHSKSRYHDRQSIGGSKPVMQFLGRLGPSHLKHLDIMIVNQLVDPNL